MAKKGLTDNQKRCEDCANLKIERGRWLCTECFNQLCEEVDDCPEGFTLEDAENLNRMDKEIKVNIKTAPKEKKARKPKEKKADTEKQTIIAETANFLKTIAQNVNITNENKLIEFDFGESHFKFDLIRRTKKKN